MTAVERFIAIAQAEIGYLEKASNTQLDHDTANAGYNNFNKFARDLAAKGYYNANKNGYEWCDIFVDWCHLQLAGGDAALAQRVECQSGPYGASCTQSVRYYREQGRFFTAPEPGDQIFFTNASGGFCHTGLVEKVEGGRVYTIEGNTSGASGVISNGGGVCRKSYALDYSRIGGYGRPRWELVPGEQPRVKPPVEAAIDKLVTAGVISSPDYWLANYRRVMYLDALIINMAAKL